jgi:hypothetical protein
MNLKKKIRETSFWKAKELIRKNKKKASYIFCADALFFIVLFCLREFLVGKRLTPADLYNLNISLLIIFSLSYVIFLILFYSLLKYIVLLIIKSMEKKAGFRIKDFLRFTLLNAIIAGIYFTAVVLLSVVLAISVKEESLPIASNIIFFTAVFVTYFYANTAQMLFILENKLRKPVKESFRILFKNCNVYAPLIANILIIALLYLAISLPLVFARASAADPLRMIYTSIAAILLYVLVFFNRLQLFVKLTNFK